MSYEQGNHTQSGIIRKGGLVGAAFCNYYERKGGTNIIVHEGVTLGRNSFSASGFIGTTFHELYHVKDIEDMGWGEFYGRWFVEMLKNGFNDAYNQDKTLENNANKAEIEYLSKIKY